MTNFTPRKVFILINGEYREITLAEHLDRRETDEEYQQKKFIGIHGMIMEVSESDYTAFYRAKRRQKYLAESAKDRGDVSYDALTTDEFNGENVIIAPEEDVAEQVCRTIMLDKLRSILPMLTENEKELVYAMYYTGLSEREYAKICGVNHNAIHKRKLRILAKLKKFLEN